MYYVYILVSLKDCKFYVGFSNNLIRRIKQHQNGMVISTRHRLHIKLICYEAYLNKKDAKKRELYLKSSNGKKELKIRVKMTLESLLLS